MIYGFYFRFLKATKNECISIILSELTYLFYEIVFVIKSLFIKKKIIEMPHEDALNKVAGYYPDPNKRPYYNNPLTNEEIDLSIVVPIYNHVELLKINLDSILKQNTIYNYEVIIVDDGSTDGATEVVKQYQRYQNVKVYFQENQGIASARNKGIDHAAGRYLMFVDCDDIVHDDLVQVLLDKAYAEDFDIVMCAHNLSKEKDGTVYSVIPNVYPDKNLLKYRNNDTIMNYPGLPWCKVYKRDLWNNVRFFPGYWYEDNIIQFLIFTQCKNFCYIPKVEYEYKWFEKNFSHIQNDDRRRKTIDSYWILKAILERYAEIGLPIDEKLYTLILKHVSVYYYNMIKGLDDDIVAALFVLAGDLLRQYQLGKKVRLPLVLRYTEKSLLQRDINLWKLSSRYQ